MENPYVPHTATVAKITPEVGGERAIKTVRLVFDDPSIRDTFTWRPGQLGMFNIFGKGEIMASICSSPLDLGYIEFSIMRVGKVTSAIHELDVGDQVGVRGPYGNWFPIEDWKGMSVHFIGGGIGQAALRSAMLTLAKRRSEYGDLTLLYGARTSRDLAYKKELEELEASGALKLCLCLDWKFDKGAMVDAEAEPGWFKINKDKPEETVCEPCTARFTGFVPQIVLVKKPKPEKSVAVTCGPPIMIKLVVGNLKKLGFKDEQIWTTLENRMKCGIGKCGRCNAGKFYVCKDGPVLNYGQLGSLPKDW